MLTGKPARTCLLLFILNFFSTITFAEGSKELNNSSNVLAYRVLLSYQQNGSYTYTSLDAISSISRMFIYANAGDSICLASSALGVKNNASSLVADAGRIRLIDPMGTMVVNIDQPTGPSNIGLIAGGSGSKNRELYGPFGLHNAGVGGYTPYVFVATVSGIYRVIFTSPDPASGAAAYAPSGTPPKANVDFVQNGGNRNIIAAFDASIVKNGAIVPGRLFSTYITLSGGQLSVTSSGVKRYMRNFYTLRILTRDGYRYNTTFRSIAPYGYNVFADNVGLMLNDNITPSYSSSSISPAPANRRLHKPDDGDDGLLTKHKLFLNDPDVTMPELAFSNGAETWLNPPLVNPDLTVDLEFSLGPSPNIFNGNFRFSYPYPGNRYQIIVDGNRDGDFDDVEDVILNGITTRGTNTLAWNGLDGNGNPYASDQANCLNAKVIIIAGEMHVAFTDVEVNAGGIEVVRLNGIKPSPDYTLHWNDAALGDNTNYDPLYIRTTPAAGVNSFGGVHRWEKLETINPPITSVEGYTGTPTHPADYGDLRFMDHWTFDSSLNKIFLPISCFSLLPLKWNYFQVRKKNDKPFLEWDMNNHSGEIVYQIERSVNGREFEKIHTLTTTNPEYNVSQFRFADEAAPPVAYYRIVAIKNGLSSVSQTVNWVSTQQDKASLSISNVGNNVLIKALYVSPQNLELHVLNSQGALVFKQKFSNTSVASFSRSSFPAGLYYLVVTQNGNKLLTKTILL
jgi:hypothetical protein